MTNLFDAVKANVFAGSASTRAWAAAFSAGPFGSEDLRVISYRGKEEISKLYSFRVVLRAQRSLDESTLESQLLGQAGCLTIDCPEGTKTFNGIVASFHIEGDQQSLEGWSLVVNLAPRMWILRQRKNSRVFQHKSVVEIVDDVLGGFGITNRWALRRNYPKHDYRVQFEETDYQFVSRILAEEGISFYFEQPTGSADGLAGDVVGLVGSAVSDVAGLASGSMSLGGAAAGLVSDAIQGASNNLAKETVVFVDSTEAFAAIGDDSLDGESLVASAVSAGLNVIGDAAGGIAGAAFDAVADVVGSRKSKSPKLYYRSVDGTAGPNFNGSISDFSLAREIRPKSSVYRMTDTLMPSVQVTLTSTGGNPDVLANLSLAGSQAGSIAAGVASVAASALGAFGAPAAVTDIANAAASVIGSVVDATTAATLQDYDHDYQDLKLMEDERSRKKRLLNQRRRDACTALGKSSCGRIGSGLRFTLDDHTRAMLNQEYLITSVEHSGVSDGGDHDRPTDDLTYAYQNVFTAVPSTTSYCPKRPTRKMKAPELGTVVGPHGEDIHVNHLGQIRVQFHWDRYGKKDDHSSCWMHVVQTWAGPQWGTQFIPRVGMQVLVTFEGGNIDRPIVTGCVYHHQHLTPFELPKHKTRSGIRTHSSPGGHGYNELSFEDSAGEEQVYIHAQRDLDEVVLHDHTTRVGRNEIRDVHKDQRETVHGDRTVRVVGADSYAVEGAQTLNIKGGRHLELDGDEDIIVGGDQSMTIAGKETRLVRAAASYVMKDDTTMRYQGSVVQIVGRSDAKRDYNLRIEGQGEISASKTIDISADKSVTLRCGKSSIVIGPERIDLVAPTVAVAAGSKFTVGAPSLLIQSSGGTLDMGGSVTISSSAIALKSGGGASGGGSTKVTTVVLKDQDGKPLANQPFKIIGADGERLCVTDDNGQWKGIVDGSAQVTFPGAPTAKKS